MTGLAMLDDEPVPALGIVPVAGRGSLPFLLLHGESLVAWASWALGAAGVDLVDFNVDWQQVRSAGRTVVLHDPLCPGTPPELVAWAVELAEETGAVVVAARTVTDTMKQVDRVSTSLACARGSTAGGAPAGRVGRTVDRDDLIQVVSPIVLPAAVCSELEVAPEFDDFAALVALVRRRYPVRWLAAPDLARRVVAADDLEVLAALTVPSGGPSGAPLGA